MTVSNFPAEIFIEEGRRHETVDPGSPPVRQRKFAHTGARDCVTINVSSFRASIARRRACPVLDTGESSNFELVPGFRDCVAITFWSFRASEARPGIQYYQYVLDADFHRHDAVDRTISITTQSLSLGRRLDADFHRHDSIDSPFANTTQSRAP